MSVQFTSVVMLDGSSDFTPDVMPDLTLAITSDVTSDAMSDFTPEVMPDETSDQGKQAV